jgi:uncharacterized protein
MTMPSDPMLPPLTESDLARLQALLDAVPAPWQPLDLSALDGFLCGVLLQPQTVPASRWLPFVTDVDAQPLTPQALDAATLADLQALVRRRHAELDRAIGARQWFDPWIFELEEADDAADDEDAGPDADESGVDASPAAGAADVDAMDDGGSPFNGPPPAVADAVLPWVAGFAAAMDAFPALMALDAPALVEPLALLYLYFDADDLEDADALLAVIETIEPPADLAEAVQDVVRALMLIADVTHPRRVAQGPARRPGTARPGGRGRKAGAQGQPPRR